MSLSDFFKSLLSTKPVVPTPIDSPTVEVAAPAQEAATTATPAVEGRLLLIHGYSADGAAFLPWKKTLNEKGIDVTTIEIGNYVTLNNEVTIKDLAEGFDRALRLTKWSTHTKDDQWTFDAIVHSTGMLVLRQWLAADPFPRTDPRSRLKRLKHLIGLAPATFGSPQAQKGRSWLGALIKGNKHLGPDFLNAGNRVLDGLELASSFTWNLTHIDLLGEDPFYDKGPETPYATVFIGSSPYSGLAEVSNTPGCDGTVRWAGCALNTRKVGIDFRREPKLLDKDSKPTRIKIWDWEDQRLGAPMIAVQGQNHGTILSSPDPGVADLVCDFVHLSSHETYDLWEARALEFGKAGIEEMNAKSGSAGDQGAGWQQLLIRMVDDHGDGVTDYNLQIYFGDSLAESDDPTKKAPVPVIADTYSGDASYRCFYVKLTKEMLSLNQDPQYPKKLWIEVIASSGSKLIEYEAYTGVPGALGDKPLRLAICDLVASPQPDPQVSMPVKLEITALAQGKDTLLFPYTTTLLEIFVEREPTPLQNVSDIFKFLQPS